MNNSDILDFLKENIFIISLGLMNADCISSVAILCVHFLMSYYIQHSYDILHKFKVSFKSSTILTTDVIAVFFVYYVTDKLTSVFTCLLWAALIVGEYYYNRDKKYILIRVVTGYIQMLILYLLCDLYG